MIQNEVGDLHVTLGGTCGSMCLIAARIYDYLHKRLGGVAAEAMAVLEMAAGSSTIGACLASNHNVASNALIIVQRVAPELRSRSCLLRQC